MNSRSRLVAGFGRLKFQLFLLAAILALRLIIFDFNVLPANTVSQPAASSHAVQFNSQKQPDSKSIQPMQTVISQSPAMSASSAASSASGAEHAMACSGTVMQRILCASYINLTLSLMDLLRHEIICNNSHTSRCPEFHPNISKFANLEDVESKQKWAKLSQNEVQRQISLSMWHAKRMDVAAARVLGCAVVDGHEFTSTFDNPKNMLHQNSMCQLHQQIHVMLPLVVFSVQGKVINRIEYLNDPKNEEWYQPFGYNPLTINDSRLAYEAPAITTDDWMQFCLREVARQSKTSNVPLPHSRAWHACSSFATSTFSKHYHYGLLKCFDVPASLIAASSEQLIQMLPFYGPDHREYIEQCKRNNVSNDDPWSLRDLSRGVFYALRDRWDKVQSVYELALYEANRDIQRADEFYEALQWNTCHPDVHALHLFIENNSSYFDTLTGPRSEDPSHFHDPCNKLRRVSLGKRLLYRDALEYANKNLAGSTVMITNADILFSKGFRSMPNLNSFLSGNRMFALSRHERPMVIMYLDHAILFV